MKKFAVVIAVMVLVVSLVSLAVASDMMKGTIKSVDTKAGSFVLSVDGGKDVTLKADKAVELSKCKVGDKVEVSADKGMAMSMKSAAAPAAAPAAKKAPVGC
jgi:hypothetical protein